jgi:hypothetical protein
VRGRRIVSARVTRGRRALRAVRGRDLRRVTVHRPTRRAFSLRVRVRTSGRHARTVTVVRRYRACG